MVIQGTWGEVDKEPRMNIFLYLDADTWVHRLDPRTKLLGVMILFAICICFNHPVYMAAVSAGVGILTFLTKAQRNLWRLRHILILLAAFSVLLWPLFVKGPTQLWSWGGLEISRESLLYAAAMGLRLSTFVAIGLLLLTTTRNEEITSGLIRLGLPHPVAFALSTALRLLPTFVGAGATIIQAQISRGLDLETGNIFRRVGKFIPQAVPLFMYAIRHTNDLAMALESRGFSPGSKRTFFCEFCMGRLDYAVLLFLGVVLAISMISRLGLSLGAVIPGRI